MMRAKDILKKLIKANTGLVLMLGLALICTDTANAQTLPGQAQSQTQQETGTFASSVKQREYKKSVAETLGGGADAVFDGVEVAGSWLGDGVSTVLGGDAGISAGGILYDAAAESWKKGGIGGVTEAIRYGVLGTLGYAYGGAVKYVIGGGIKVLAHAPRISTVLSAHVGGWVLEGTAWVFGKQAQLYNGLADFIENKTGIDVKPLRWIGSGYNLLSEGFDRAGKFLHEFGNSAAGMKTNEECKIDKLQERYLSNCYSCLVVKTLLETFMSAGARVYDLAKEAGTIILMIGTFITLAFMVLRNVSSFANVEPADQVNSILVFLFKVLVAFLVVNAGVNVLVQYMVNPILEAGADVGIEIIHATGDDVIKSPDNKELGLSTVRKYGDAEEVNYAYAGAGVVSAAVLNKVLALNQSLDMLTSQNLIIGNALSCHATHAGTLRDASGAINLGIPDIFIWLVGVALWFLGFMLTLGISYYLLDSSFKIGFAIMFLPIAIALWPFNLTKDKLPKIFSIILRAGAVYMFLAIVTAFAMKLLSNSFGGADELLDRIIANDSMYVAKTFSITSINFIIIVICYLYSLKLVSSSVNDYAGQFVKDNTFGDKSPMHGKLTQATGQVTNYAKSGAKLGKDIAVTQGKKGAGKLMQAMAKK